jgi:hypothetical protein
VLPAQGLADSLLKSNGRRTDSVDVESRLRWLSHCPYSDFFYASTCVVSDLPASSPPGPLLRSEYVGLKTAVGAVNHAEARDAVDSIPIVIGEWHGVIEAHRVPARRDLAFVLLSANTTGARALFTVQCRSGRLEASLDVPASLRHGASQTVTARYDAELPNIQRWVLAPGRSALVLAGRQPEIRAFIDKLADHTSLDLQLRQPQAATAVLVFDLQGIRFVATELENECRG